MLEVLNDIRRIFRRLARPHQERVRQKLATAIDEGRWADARMLLAQYWDLRDDDE